MEEANVPTARAFVATTETEAAQALDEFGAPYVVKDDGLAAGKGVVVTENRDTALEHANACFAAGGSVVIEEFLDGPEVSLFVISDGKNVLPLSPAQDFKRIFDNDEGPNTGGMGAYTPLDWLPAGFVDEVIGKIARPTITRMAERGTPFVGVLFCWHACPPRSGSCSLRHPAARSPKTPAWSGTPAPPWTWSWRQKTTREPRVRAMRSRGLRTHPTCPVCMWCMPEPLSRARRL